MKKLYSLLTLFVFIMCSCSSLNSYYSKLEKDNDGNEEDIDPDLDDSDVLNLEEEQLNKEEEQENKNKFDPIKFLVERLRQINLNKNNHQDDLDLSLEKSELNGDVNDSGDLGKDILNAQDENKAGKK